MEIHDLNTKTLTDPAYIAFDDGTDTYKAEFNDAVEEKAAAAVAAADLTQNAVAFTSGDAASPTAWSNVSVITSGSTLATLFNRISTMVKNVRYLWALIGSSSFQNVASTLSGAIGNTALSTTATTLSGAIAEHETDISTLNGNVGNIRCGRIENITNSSNYNMVSNNILTKGGVELLFLATSTVATNSASIYFTRTTTTGTVYITSVYEGSANSAPILSGNGILNTRNSSAATNVGYDVFRLL